MKNATSSALQEAIKVHADFVAAHPEEFRLCLLLHRQHLQVQMQPALPAPTASSPPTLSRAARAHFRLSWQERLLRNARTEAVERITLTLFGIPERVATFLGLAPI